MSHYPSHNTSTVLKIRNKNKRRSLKGKVKDPVDVFCRIRPLGEEHESGEVDDGDGAEEVEKKCIEIVSETVLQLNPPKSSLAFKAGNKTATRHTFKQIFTGQTNQKQLFDHVALPVVHDLLKSKNGLIFTYGITNSGKTYTMTGTSEQSGILPRSLDIIFNSISDLLAKSCVFKSDKMNGFDVNTEAEADVETRRQKRQKLKNKLQSGESDEDSNLDERVPDESLVQGLDEDNSYAVFISYYEIYNNYVFDLLDEQAMECVKVASKQLREDAKRNMYVSGCVELEVRNAEEACALLEKGQKMRRMAETNLNHNSSRSHAIFNIRLVQAPLDPNGEEVIQDKTKVKISQLSLVDLAGSERTSRTKAEGEQLREAGNINASLMVLRNCMDTLRENQSQGVQRIVPYRNSKLTHLFKNIFEGEGKVRMIVCVNPRNEDYDETIHVLRFSEVTQNVVVERSEEVRHDIAGLAPGRRRANLLYKNAMKQLDAAMKDAPAGEVTRSSFHALQPPSDFIDKESNHISSDIISESDPITSEQSSDDCLHPLHQSSYPPSLPPPPPLRFLAKHNIPSLSFDDFLTKNLPYQDYSHVLKEQIKLKKRFKEEFSRRKSIFYKHLLSFDEELETLRARHTQLKAILSDKDRDLLELTEKIKKLAKSNQQLQRSVDMYTLNCREREEELEAANLKLQQEVAKRERLKLKMSEIVTHEKVRWESRLRNKAIKSEAEFMATINDYERKLDQLKSLVTLSEEAKTDELERRYHTPAAHRKRTSSESNKWLEHKPHDFVKVDTLLQPQLKRKKTVTNPSSRDLTSRSIDRYVLTHQEEANDGDVLTELYKGDVTRTRGGGTAVRFTDIEKLHHDEANPPPVTPRKKQRRSGGGGAGTPTSARTPFRRISTLGIEGHKNGVPPGIAHRLV